MLEKLAGQQVSKCAQMVQSTFAKHVDSFTFEKLFRHPGDLKQIDKVVERNIRNGEKINMAFIGLGKSGIEPLTYMTQVFLTAKKCGKNLDDVLGKIDFIDVQKASEVKHSMAILNELEKTGVQKFQNFGYGLAPKEKEQIYNKFVKILKESDSKYLGHNLEDFVDNVANHQKYDLTFCNNVFYYVGKGNGAKYQYTCPGIHEFFITPGCFDRYNQVLTNLLSTTKQGGKTFFHHDVGGEAINDITKSLKTLLPKLKSFKESELNVIDRLQ